MRESFQVVHIFFKVREDGLEGVVDKCFDDSDRIQNHFVII